MLPLVVGELSRAKRTNERIYMYLQSRLRGCLGMLWILALHPFLIHLQSKQILVPDTSSLSNLVLPLIQAFYVAQVRVEVQAVPEVEKPVVHILQPP